MSRDVDGCVGDAAARVAGERPGRQNTVLIGQRYYIVLLFCKALALEGDVNIELLTA